MRQNKFTHKPPKQSLAGHKLSTLVRELTVLEIFYGYQFRSFFSPCHQNSSSQVTISFLEIYNLTLRLAKYIICNQNLVDSQDTSLQKKKKKKKKKELVEII